ncbi:selenium cofactor biosynthesis protein YqeC [Thermodesulfobacteriota bacterium]
MVFNGTNTLIEAFDIQPGEVISLVGAGGKTTLMFALARELASAKGLVVTTTTTKIFPPSSKDTPYVLISNDGDRIKNFILSEAAHYDHITIASEKLTSSGKLNGIGPDLILELCKLSVVTHMIVEADGAARKPLKAPNIEHEPVIPQNTSLVIPVVGIDALGCELKDEFVFRAEIAAGLTGMPIGEIVSSETIALLMTHRSGVIYGSPVQARIIPFINKADLDGSLPGARKIATRILEARHPQINRVVLGQAKSQPHVLEVLDERYI